LILVEIDNEKVLSDVFSFFPHAVTDCIDIFGQVPSARVE